MTCFCIEVHVILTESENAKEEMDVRRRNRYS